MEIKGNVLMEKYETGKLLGQGTFAKVYHGRNIKTGQSVAIKVIDKEKVQKVGLINHTKREISVMKLVRHPNVVQLYEVMATKTKIYLVMEYAKGGELFHKLAKGRLKETYARKFFQQLIGAVDYCHSRGVYHRDLKPENLLLDENGVLKVSDFGLSALAESGREDGLLHTTCGTPAYVAPEVISRNGYDGAKADVWSCGVILFVLLAGRLPFSDPNLIELYKKINKAEYRCPNWFPREARRLLSRILDPNPSTRVSIAEIMQNPWFRKGLESKQTRPQVEDMEKAVSNFDSAFTPTEGKLELAKPAYLNAFDIISLSTGLDLSGLFIRNDQKDEVKFTSARPASAIVSTLEDIAANLKLKVNKKEEGLIKLEQLNAGRYGTLAIDVELFPITSSFHLVELRKTNGDAMEFQKMLQEDIRPALKEVVWAWQGEEQQHQQ